MNFVAFLTLLLKKWKTILVFGVLGFLLGSVLANFQEKTYEARVFVSFGASWNTGADSSAYDSMQASENFAQKMLGVLKGGSFDERLDSAVGFDANCNVSTFEKGNLLLTCQTASSVEAQTLAEKVPSVLENILREYNSATGEFYAIGDDASRVAETTPAIYKSILAVVLISLLFGIFVWITFWAVVRGRVWSVFQIEEILGHDVPLLLSTQLLGLAPANLFFVGSAHLPDEHKKANLFSENFTKFNSEKDFLVVVLDEASVNDLKFIKNFSEKARVLATDFQK